MATDYLGLFASQHNFKFYRQKIYGVYNGYDVCITLDSGMLACYFNTQVTELNSFINILEQDAAKYGVLTYRLSPPIVAVLAQNVHITQVLDFVTQLLRMCKATTSELCSFCGMRLKEEERTYFIVDGVVCVAHEHCYVAFNDKINKEMHDLLAAKKPWYKVWLMPILVAVLLSLLTLVGIALISELSTQVFWIGSLFTGYVCALAYFNKGGKKGLQSYLFCILLTMLCAFAVQALYQSYLIVQQYANVSFLQALITYFTLFASPSTFLGRILPEYALSILFGVIAVVLGHYKQRQQTRGKVNIHKL